MARTRRPHIVRLWKRPSFRMLKRLRRRFATCATSKPLALIHRSAGTFLHRGHLDFDCHLPLRSAFVVALDWNDVGVIPTSRDFDVVVIGLSVICGIQTAPAEIGNIDLAPRVGSLGTDGVARPVE